MIEKHKICREPTVPENLEEVGTSSIRITDKWKLPLTRMQIEELDKMVDFYSRIYKKGKPKVEEVKAWTVTFKG